MDYIYGISTRNGVLCENLKTVGTEHSNLSGYISTVRDFSDGTKIEDRCLIVEKYASKQVNGICYDWYRIKDHYRDTDTTQKAKAEVDKVSANLDYISMMAGIEIPVEEGDMNV